MAETASNVFVSKPREGGAVYSAEITATAPTNATATLSGDFHSLGFISENGIADSVETESTDIKAYGGKNVKTVQTSYKESFRFTPIETNQYVLAELYGDDNVTVDSQTGAITLAHKGADHPLRWYVFEFDLGDSKVKRSVIKGRVTDIGETTYSDGTAVAAEITITAEPDADGCYVKEYVATVS